MAETSFKGIPPCNCSNNQFAQRNPCLSEIETTHSPSAPRIVTLLRNLRSSVRLSFPPQRNCSSSSLANDALPRSRIRIYSRHRYHRSRLQERFPILEYHVSSSNSRISRCLYHTSLSKVRPAIGSILTDSEPYISGEYVLGSVLMALGLSLGVYGGFVMDCIYTICDYLDINCLTIKKKTSHRAVQDGKTKKRYV